MTDFIARMITPLRRNLLSERTLRERPIESGGDAILREFVLAAQKLENALHVGLAEIDLVVVRDLGRQVDPPDRLDVAGRAPQLLRHAIEASEIADQFQRFLRPYAF